MSRTPLELPFVYQSVEVMPEIEYIVWTECQLSPEYGGLYVHQIAYDNDSHSFLLRSLDGALLGV